jgi:hypothetical protein
MHIHGHSKLIRLEYGNLNNLRNNKEAIITPLNKSMKNFHT